MNLFRLLLLLVLVWIVWRLLTLRRRSARRPVGDREHFEPMARCQRCGTHLPARSLSSDGRCGRCGE